MESNEQITNESETISISDLKSFTIRGLFGYKDIVLPLDKEVLILIAENGAGKTNILNILYQVLNRKTGLIKSLNCDSVSIEFSNNKKYEIDFTTTRNEFDIPLIDNIENYCKPNKWGWSFNDYNPCMMINQIKERYRIQDFSINKINTKEDQAKIFFICLNNDVDNDNIIENISQTRKDQQRINESDSNLKEIKNLKFNILYSPTYRRIEKDLYNLGYENVELQDNTTNLIQFGMEDVKNKFKQIQTEIKNTAFDLFSKVTGGMLTQFIEGLDVTPEMRESIDIDILDLILSRVGEKNISQIEQEKIKKLVSSEEINDPKYNDLVYFLSKLIDLYKDQKTIDETIKSFVNVCNKYLNPSKQIIYDESTAKIYIKQTRNDKTIELNNLSSGEKQIISLFSKVYLEAEDDFILIIDEPELSISVEWQQMLLPDIMRSGKCKRLIAATHSPFIFDNELDNCAYALDQFVTEH